ncbi:MAG TPA: tRNA (adenosine(37)-N6)-threonylcarbamoyltransferase complex ATPase subunit type 1 TsaE [Phycisphaerales bacterium]|nr:tRNA (adenosine(37)-N6)-threonylcarbamoyltransferase complex ATPase subunit type 1 TsaE [Phycisphaerales bacterium]
MSGGRAILSRVTEGEERTIALGADLGRLLRAGDVVALHGELGAGKTRFVRGLARGMGADPDAVSSPTFVVMQEYAAPGANLIHIDAYRLQGGDELDAIGWDRIADGRSVLAIEWAERIESELPARGTGQAGARFDVVLEHQGDELRRLTIEGPAERLLELPGTRPAEGITRACPSCSKTVGEDCPTFPFCSPRCRDADLGKWFTESYRISREIKEADLDEGS